MKTCRYVACTLNGTVLYRAETAQEISDAICTHIMEDREPRISYSFDNTPEYVYPFVTWKRAPEGGTAGWIGTPWKTFEDVERVTRGGHT